MIMNVPNIVTSSPSGGRFDFDDGGTYCGGWQDGKAHGHGVCTGPKNVGEYSGSWNFGFEMSGVYKWTNGAVYEGRWQNGKRHGVGVEYNGKWIYKGEWSQGLKGRYGVKASSNSAVKYEGTWANGLQDGYGSETYSDGGYYQGQMCRGLRHGYGVRKSAPYGDSQLNNPSKNGPLTGGPPSSMLIHSNSIQSAGSAADFTTNDDDSPKPEDGFKPNIDRTLVSKNGFVLVSKPLDVPMPSVGQSSSSSKGERSHLFPPSASSKRRNSLTNKLANSASRIPNQTTATLLRGLRLKKQKSTSDLDQFISNKSTPSRDSQNNHQADNDLPIVPFTLSPEELDITDPTTVETYMGEWKHDKRNGNGVCERSDGLKYEGQWHNDMKSGYGITTFKDGTKEEGKYKNNILIVDSKVKKFFQLGGSNIRQKIDDAVKLAHQAQSMALKKAEIADTRAATARDKADQAMTAAYEADRDSQIAYSVARQYSDSQQQMALQQQQLGLLANSINAPGGVHLAQHTNAMAINNDTSISNQQFSGQQFVDQQQQAMPNLNMATSPLQMRRISQHQQQQQLQFKPILGPNNQQQQQQQQQQQNQFNQQQNATLERQQQQFLGPVEPFNGRRGSFRGGSHPPLGNKMTSGASVNNRQHYHNQHYQQAPVGQGGGVPFSHHQLRGRQSSDPFSDMFDHYKSGAGGNSASSVTGGLRQRRILSKQTSLDYNQLNRASVPRQMGSSSSGQYDDSNQTTASTTASNQLSRRFRMSSLDNADENRRPQDLSRANMQHQLKHLVTSGEDLQAVAATGEIVDRNDLGNNEGGLSAAGPTTTRPDMSQITNNPTPTGSYLQSRNSSSLLGVSNQSPSTNESNFTSSNAPVSSRQTPSQANYFSSAGGQQATSSTAGSFITHQHPNQAPPSMSGYQQAALYAMGGGGHSYHQRDVHSLADEQLYLADNRRRFRPEHELDKSDYSNYDFTISNAPRPSQRCMRRTASMSRHSQSRAYTSLIGVADGRQLVDSSKFGSQNVSQLNTNTFNRSQQRSTSPALSSFTAQSRQQTFVDNNTDRQLQQQHGIDITLDDSRLFGHNNQTLDGQQQDQYHHRHLDQMNMGMANNVDFALHQQQQQNSSHLTLDSLSSTIGLNRKPSLQVRYDLTQLGGLMSREEVARLSHAQREQKRLEAELAEQRAKRPLLHLYLSVKEFVASQQLFISILFINLCLIKLFADLIA